MRQKLYHAIDMESNILPSKILLLHNIRSNQNVGSLFRSADAVGIEKLYLGGITPSPIDRFGRPVGAIAKTALGAERTIPWEKIEDTHALIVHLKKQGYQIIAIEQAKKSVDYKKIIPQLPTVFILGNEVDGIAKEIIDLADVVTEIPMQGKKESLNVAVAGGVVLFRMLDR